MVDLYKYIIFCSRCYFFRLAHPQHHWNIKDKINFLYCAKLIISFSYSAGSGPSRANHIYSTIQISFREWLHCCGYSSSGSVYCSPSTPAVSSALIRIELYSLSNGYESPKNYNLDFWMILKYDFSFQFIDLFQVEVRCIRCEMHSLLTF